MNKIFGDEFKSEIKKLKLLDKKILQCKAQSIRIKHICKQGMDNKSTLVTLTDAIYSLRMLSKRIKELQNLITECEELHNSTDNNILKILYKNDDDVYNFKYIQRLRIGAEYLSDNYDSALKDFQNKLNKKGERNE